MKVENPVAFHFIMQDELYLLPKDKGLYNNTFAVPQPDIETTPVNFNYLGGNKKGFLIVSHYPNWKFIDDIHLVALESTLKRLGFNIEDVAIINRATYSDAAFDQLLDFFKPQKMLLLGAVSIPAGIEGLNLNVPTQVNKCNILFTFSFDEMMDNTENKKAFWEQMKRL